MRSSNMVFLAVLGLAFTGCAKDSDGDGRGDNPAPAILWDDCPLVAGDSTIDRFGCIDEDGDGYSNPDDSWGWSSGADAFPLDPLRWVDDDQDGFDDILEDDILGDDILLDDKLEEEVLEEEVLEEEVLEEEVLLDFLLFPFGFSILFIPIEIDLEALSFNAGLGTP